MYALINSGTGTQTFMGNQAFQNALNLQGPVTFTSGSSINFSNTTVSNLTQSSVGLSNVNNTSDSNKPVSTAQQTALNLKSNIASPTFTGVLTSPNVTATTITLNGNDLYTALSNLAPLSNPSFSGNLNLTSFSILTNSTTYWLYNNTNNPSVNFSLNQTGQGATTINSSSGQIISLNIGNVQYANVSSSGLYTTVLTTPSIIFNGTSLTSILALLAPLSSPSFSGTVSTPAITLNGTSLSTTLGLLSPKASPTFTGILTTPAITLNGTDLTTTLNSKQSTITTTTNLSLGNLQLNSTSQTTPILQLYGQGGSGCSVAINLDTFASRTGGPASIIKAIDNGSNSNDIVFYTSTSGSASTTASERMRIYASGAINMNNALSCNSLNVQKASIASDNSSIWLYNNANGYGSNFALYQSSSGNTVLNSSSGQTLDFKINNSTCMSISSNGVTLNNINLISPDITLNGSSLNTSLGLLAPKTSATLTTPTINTPTINNATLNNTTVNNGITINQITQNGATFGSGMTFNYGNPAISYNILPNYLGTFFCGGCPFTSSGLPLMSNQRIAIMWASPIANYGTTVDSYMNTAIIEVSYWIQECPINTSSSTTFQNYGFVSGNSLYSSYFINGQSTSTSSSTVNLNVGNLFCCGTGIFYIANSASGTSSSSSYVKYLSGSFSGGGGSLLSSTTRYGTTFTPVTFSAVTFNRLNISFNYPAYNNSTSTNTYNTGQYISNYGCSCRILGSEPANGSNIGNIYPYNSSYQACNSFSYMGRAFLAY
jgi:hypothetical protein